MIDKNIIKYINEKDVEYAKTLIEEKFKDNMKLYNYYMGLCFCCEKNFLSAIFYFKRSIEYGLRNVFVFYNLGVAYIETDNFKAAEKCFMNCIELDNFFIKSYINLAYIYYKDKNYKKAYQIIKLCLAFNNDDYIKKIEKKLLYLVYYF
ncbi:MAG: hypothetical protein N2448_09995 [Caloramator sp.]|nr:hypothetical protein [Caloramator sp.]